MSKLPPYVRDRETWASIGLHFAWYLMVLSPLGSFTYLLAKRMIEEPLGGVISALATAAVASLFGWMMVAPGVFATAILMLPVLLFGSPRIGEAATALVVPAAALLYFAFVGDPFFTDDWGLITAVSVVAGVSTVFVYRRLRMFGLLR